MLLGIIIGKPVSHGTHVFTPTPPPPSFLELLEIAAKSSASELQTGGGGLPNCIRGNNRFHNVDEVFLNDAVLTMMTNKSLIRKLSLFQPTLGVSPPHRAMLFVLLSPVGPYFKTGTFQPVRLLADTQYVRAWEGGTGKYKLGG